MAKLSDKQKKKIIAERVNGASLQSIAKKYKVSETTVRRVIASDKEMAEKVAEKKEQNATEIIAHMDTMKNSVCNTLDKLLLAINDDEKISKASINQLATTMGILVDKFTANENIAPSQAHQNNNLLDIIRETVGSIKKETNYEIREIEPKANSGDAVVGDPET